MLLCGFSITDPLLLTCDYKLLSKAVFNYLHFCTIELL